MCFSHDDFYDWYASVQVVSTGSSPFWARCCECGKKIPPHEWRWYIYQQEHEECQRCEWEELDADEEPCKQHDYGETVSAFVCETCHKIASAIEAYELRRGCKVTESRPLVGDLRDELFQHDDAALYATVAIETFPELGEVPWLLDSLSRGLK